MKLRISRSELSFLLQDLQKKGFKLEKSDVKKGTGWYYLMKQNKGLTIKYTQNGWVTINN